MYLLTNTKHPCSYSVRIKYGIARTALQSPSYPLFLGYTSLGVSQILKHANKLEACKTSSGCPQTTNLGWVKLMLHPIIYTLLPDYAYYN